MTRPPVRADICHRWRERACVALLVLPLLMVTAGLGALSGLTGCVAERTVENGPLGPERETVRPVWPWSVCHEAPAATVEPAK